MRSIVCLVLLGACGGAARTTSPPVHPATTGSAAPPAATPAAPAAPAAGAPADAATPLVDVLLHGHSTPATFEDLDRVLPGLPVARQAAIRALGSTKEAPIHVPSIQYEYVWVAHFACTIGKGTMQQQSLIHVPGAGDVDDLSFTCPDSSDPHDAFFDFSDDPQEQAMRRELGQQH